MIRPRFSLVFSAVVGAFCLPSVQLGAAELELSLNRLFALGSRNTPTAVTAAREQYEALKRQRPKDARIDYAYAIVLMNQHRYRDSGSLLARYAEGKQDLNAACLKIWAQLHDRRYAEVLDGAAELSGRLGEGVWPNEAEQLNAARFLGSVFGYMELARTAVSESHERGNRKDQVLSRLSSSQLESFDEGRAEVAARLERLRFEHRTAQDRAAQAIEERQSKTKSAFDDDQKTIAASNETINTSAEQLREAERELNVIRQQLEAIMPDRVRLGAQIITLQTQLTQNQLGNLVDLRKPGEQMQQATTTTVRQGNPRVAHNIALGMSLTLLNKQAFDLDRRILTLQNRAAALESHGGQESEKLARSDEQIRKTAKHAKAVEKKLNREQSKSKPRVDVMTSQMTSPSTYLPFPYEREKARVLDWFSK